MNMNSHDYVEINGKPILHSTARRDYVCGNCGSRLVTLFLDGEWKTVCSVDMKHSPFVTDREWQALTTKQMIRAEVGREVFANLPDELKKSILGG